LNVLGVGAILATALLAVIEMRASWWLSFRIADRATAAHIIRGIPRPTAIVNYVRPF
jgi:hypothetical protein